MLHCDDGDGEKAQWLEEEAATDGDGAGVLEWTTTGRITEESVACERITCGGVIDE